MSKCKITLVLFVLMSCSPNDNRHDMKLIHQSGEILVEHVEFKEYLSNDKMITLDIRQINGKNTNILFKNRIVEKVIFFESIDKLKDFTAKNANSQFWSTFLTPVKNKKGSFWLVITNVKKDTLGGKIYLLYSLDEEKVIRQFGNP